MAVHSLVCVLIPIKVFKGSCREVVTFHTSVSRNGAKGPLHECCGETFETLSRCPYDSHTYMKAGPTTFLMFCGVTQAIIWEDSPCRQESASQACAPGPDITQLHPCRQTCRLLDHNRSPKSTGLAPQCKSITLWLQCNSLRGQQLLSVYVWQSQSLVCCLCLKQQPLAPNHALHLILAPSMPAGMFRAPKSPCTDLAGSQTLLLLCLFWWQVNGGIAA